MKDFTFFAPTEVVFGAKAENEIGRLVKHYGGHKVLVHYGGGSVKKSGLLDVVLQQLQSNGLQAVTLGGVVPNPLLSMVYQGIELCRKENVDFILAVGGGSVIDSAKAIAYGVPYEGDVWDFWNDKAQVQAALPVGAVLTIPAAGSEMSNSCVITKDDTEDKRGVNTQFGRCKFAVMNPERTYTLPPYQTAAGVADIMMHTMERYFSNDDDMTLTDAMAEALLRTVKDSAVEVLNNPTNYRHRAQIMWAGSLSHNDLTGCGTTGDWATHRLEHELSSLFGVTHGAGLAAVWPAWARFVCKKHLSRFVRFAVNVMKVENDFTNPEGTAEKGIQAMEAFYKQIGMPINITELVGRPVTDDEIDFMADKCSRGGTLCLGNLEVLDVNDMKTIYKMAR